jgi:hypothetical protein
MRSLKIIGLAPKKTNSLEGPITITANENSRTGGALLKLFL